MKRQKPSWTEKHSFDVRRALEKHVLPDLGHLTIADIDRQEALKPSQKKKMAALKPEELPQEPTWNRGIV